MPTSLTILSSRLLFLFCGIEEIVARPKIPGFDSPDAVLTGVETRTSCSIRLKRDETFQSVNTKGLFPAGEGAGYAGGILSAGVDGIKVAEAVARSIIMEMP